MPVEEISCQTDSLLCVWFLTFEPKKYDETAANIKAGINPKSPRLKQFPKVPVSEFQTVNSVSLHIVRYESMIGFFLKLPERKNFESISIFHLL